VNDLIQQVERCMARPQNQPLPAFRDSRQAFEDAIAEGRLSADRQAGNYAGNFMYMGTSNGRDSFKNIATRTYLA
jgi:hypothetical protein